MKIVKFKDGTYGIRRGWFALLYQYKDLKTPYWWYRDSNYIEDCKGTLELATKVLNSISDYGTIVK